MKILGLDHLLLTVADIEASCAFYESVLGCRIERFDDDRHAIHFGTQKINLHKSGAEREPKAQRALPGTADICLIASTPLAEVIAHLESHGVAVELGPVPRTGARGPILSVYIRDPDLNLIEIANEAG